jgi:protein translocase SecG subunit
MLSVSITILTVLLVIVSILLILIVLMQRPKQEGLGAAFGGGMMNEALGAHTTDILQKGTVWLAVMFFSFSIFLAILKTKEISSMQKIDVLKGVKQEQLPPTPPPSMLDFPAPSTPDASETGAPAPDAKGGEAPKIDDGAADSKGSGKSEDAPKPADPKPAADSPDASAPKGDEAATPAKGEAAPPKGEKADPK